jgi:hypothetical protein
MANVVVTVRVIMPEEEMTSLAPSGELTCTVCDVCFALVPLIRIVEHGQRLHSKEPK